MRAFFRFALLPLLGYIVCYFVLTFPLVLSWRSAYFCDSGDGPQMVWNIWWVKHAILQLHQLPWQTHLLYYPGGVTLLLDSLSPINGFMGIPLSLILSPIEVYNTLIIFAFALAGLTAFWLAYDATQSYWPSLAAGYAFTFCSLHFAHALGHLHQITTGFVPLFLLCWLMLLRKPSALRAIAAAIVLFLVLLSDHYLFVFCLMASPLIAAWKLIFEQAWKQWRNREAAMSLLVFVVVCSLTSLPLLLAMFSVSVGRFNLIYHDPQLFSADLFSLFVPGWTWCFHSLTRSVWEPIGSYVETSVSIGLAILIAAMAGFICRRRVKFPAAGMWAIIALLFASLALGPTLRVLTIPVTRWMPYRLLETIFPPMRLGGCPGRMMVMTQLSCAVLAAAGLKALANLTNLKRTLLGIIFVLSMVIESEPRVQATLGPTMPGWVRFLGSAPRSGGLIDLISRGSAMGTYYQIAHHLPMQRGYISRPPPETNREASRIEDLAENEKFAELAKMGFTFVAVEHAHAPMHLPIIYHDGSATIYQIFIER